MTHNKHDINATSYITWSSVIIPNITKVNSEIQDPLGRKSQLKFPFT